MPDRLTPEQIAALQQYAVGMIDVDEERTRLWISRLLAALAERDAEIARLTQERDEYKALSKIGAWHADCRPNRHKAVAEIEKGQRRIDQLADALAQAHARIAQLEARYNTGQ